jgi:hypothetical protein
MGSQGSTHPTNYGLRSCGLLLAQVICPSGSLLTGVSSPVCKNISVSIHPKSLLELFASRPTEGRIAIVTDAGRDAVDAAAFCARRDRRAGSFEFVSGQQHADERCCCGRRSRVVLTPRRWRQVRGGRVGPTGFRRAISAGDGGKRARSPRRARRKPLKPLRAGMPGDSGVLVYSCAFYQSKVHTRLRVQRASGIPHALCFSWAKNPCTTRAHRAARARTRV